MTLAACIECVPTHTFGKGWSCFKCGQPSQPPRLYKEWAERMAEIEGDADPTTGLPPDKATCSHEYKCVYEGWEDETYQCSLCGDRYKLYDEDMK